LSEDLRFDQSDRETMIPIENWVRVRGPIEAVEESPVDEHLSVTIVIGAVEPVEGFPNRLHKEAGDRLTVQVPISTVPEDSIETDAILSARVRRADSDRVFAHPDEVEIRPPTER
jgi:hypothetical protein